MDEKHAEPACISLVNTLDWRLSGEPVDRLLAYDDVLAWAREAGVLGARYADTLAREARLYPRRAQATLHRARDVREIIARILSSHAHGRRPVQRDVELLGVALAEAMSNSRLSHTRDGYALTWADEVPNLDRPWWSAVHSAGELLMSPRRHRIKQCADRRGCGWLLLDTTKNNTRRFCTSDSCANVAKQARHRERLRRAAGVGKAEGLSQAEASDGPS